MCRNRVKSRIRSALKHLVIMPFFLSLLVPGVGFAQMIALDMKRDGMADYGASPWYVHPVAFGSSDLKLAFDTGARFLWATSDQCTTPACKEHSSVNTNQPGFNWIDQTTTTRSFGPWGDMKTRTGKVSLTLSQVGVSLDQQFFAAINYDGSQFGTLDWDGGIGFPSESSLVEAGSDFFFRDLYYSGDVGKAEFSFFTDPSGAGYVGLGGDIPGVFDPATEVRLEPKKSPTPADGYLWGTELHAVIIGTDVLPGLLNQIFFVDTGSSRFKGDGQYVYPILETLYKITDSGGNQIFEKYFEAGVWTGLQYANGGPAAYPKLPNLSIVIGQSCKTAENQAVKVSLTPSQYSYLVDTGDRQGKYVVAVHRLDGVGGLLVGSTFMDYVYTRFTHGTPSQNVLTQSDMFIYEKVASSDQPAGYECLSL